MTGAVHPSRVRIGVTGHLSLPDPGRVSRTVGEILQDLLGKRLGLPAPVAAPAAQLRFTILSSLAEGADRLVAREILRFPGSELEAVLPLAPADYEQDFPSEDSKQEFRDLLKRSRRTLVMATGRSTTTPPEIRVKAYEEAGRYVVDHCDLLIAVWDGKPARGRGGTAEIVAYARSKGCPLVIVPMKNPESFCHEKGR